MANTTHLIVAGLALAATGATVYQTSQVQQQREDLVRLQWEQETNRTKLREHAASLDPLQREWDRLKSVVPPSITTSTPPLPTVRPRGEGIAPSAVSARTNPDLEVDTLHRRYDPLLHQLKLTPAQADQFIALRLSLNQARADLQAAVEQNGLRGHSEVVKAQRSKLTEPMWNEIRQLLGSEGFKAYGDYEVTSAYRPMIETMFHSAGIPISAEQTEHVTRLMRRNQKTFQAKPTDIGSQVQFDWNATALDAEKLLTPVQLSVLRAQAARNSNR